jgi:hypothetical protein
MTKIFLPKLYIIALLFFITISCNKKTNEDKINPSLVRVYLNEITGEQGKTETSFVSLDFRATTDNGFIYIGIGGAGVESTLSKNGSFSLMKIDSKGELIWEKYYDEASLNLGYGFPSNIIATDIADEYILFWNKIVNTNFEYYQIKFKVDANVAPTLQISKINLNVGTNKINIGTNENKNGGYIARATQNLAKNGYVLMNVATNSVRTTDNSEQHKVLINNISSASPTANTTLLSETVIKGLRQGIEALRDYDNHYQLFATNQYYYNIPDGNDIMALSSVGGTQTPIFRDSTSYWVSSVYQNQGTISLLINAKSAVDASYYIPSIDLAPNNYNIARIATIASKVETLSSKTTTILTTNKDGITILGGSNIQGEIVVAFYKNFQNIFTFELANANYVICNIIMSKDGNFFAIAGTNSVLGQTWKRPFIVLIPKAEIIK